MKKSVGLILFLTLILSACSQPASSSEESSLPPSSDTTSSSEVIESSSEKEESSEEASSSEVTTNAIKTIAEAKSHLEELKAKANEAGVYESDIDVELKNVQMMFALDSGTTKALYGNKSYKSAFSDGKDMIYAKYDSGIYEYLSKYKDKKSNYDIKGKLAYYNGNVEIALTEKPKWLEASSKVVNYNEIATPLTIKQIYEEGKKVLLNIKGNGYGKLVKVNAKCLARDVNNTNMYFGVGDEIIQVHGSNKVTNGMTKGNDYTVIGAINIYHYRIELEIVDILMYTGNAIEVKDPVEEKTPETFYRYTYDKDPNSYSPKEVAYTDFYSKAYKVKGYFTSYILDDLYHFVLSPVFNENGYPKYENARNAKCLFAKNEGLNKTDMLDENLFEVHNQNQLVEFTIYPYEFNSKGYPTAYFEIESFTLVA